MSITLGRIDFRLLHGIVATMWAPQSGAQRVMVIDDKEGTVVSSRASVLDDQKEVYKKIIENGTKVDVQFTTTDKAEPLESKVSL